MKLPIPIFYKENIHKEVQIDEPESGVLANAHKISQTGDHFSSSLSMLIGIVKSIAGENGLIEEKNLIKPILYKMPWNTAEFLLEEAMLLMDPEAEYIEGMYTCDRNGCGYIQYAERKVLEDDVVIDTRDSIHNLQVTYYEGDINNIHIQLTKPTTIINEIDKSVLAEIDNFDMIFPTIENCITAFAKYGGADRTRLRFGIWLEAITKVNGEYVDNRWKNSYGMFFLDHIKKAFDLKEIAKETQKYGRTPYVTKRCPKCNKIFKSVINKTGFFDSALDS